MFVCTAETLSPLYIEGVCPFRQRKETTSPLLWKKESLSFSLSISPLYKEGVCFISIDVRHFLFNIIEEEGSTDAEEMRGSNGQYPTLNDPHVVRGKLYKKRGINMWCKTCDSLMGWAASCRPSWQP